MTRDAACSMRSRPHLAQTGIVICHLPSTTATYMPHATCHMMSRACRPWHTSPPRAVTTASLVHDIMIYDIWYMCDVWCFRHGAGAGTYLQPLGPGFWVNLGSAFWVWVIRFYPVYFLSAYLGSSGFIWVVGFIWVHLGCRVYPVCRVPGGVGVSWVVQAAQTSG
jgi:hypothetical protein